MNTRSFAGEEWKQINMGEGFTKSSSLEISNWGRIRSCSAPGKYRILAGSRINGYRILRHRLFKPRDAETENNLKFLKAPVLEALKNITALKKELRKKNISLEEKVLLNNQLDKGNLLFTESKKTYDTFYNIDYKKRTVYVNELFHRLVAEYFLPKPSEDQTIVAHLDYDKENNNVSNLRWMSLEENSAHQQSSPLVISTRKSRRLNMHELPGNYKLSVTKVMFLKKLLNEGKSIKTLAKQFKVTENQVINIKNERNWSLVEAAK